jgi:hypothetical protein
MSPVSAPVARHIAHETALDAPRHLGYSPLQCVGDELQGAAGDCNSPGATRAWFDSRVAHHFLPDTAPAPGFRPRFPPQVRLLGHNVANQSFR